MNRYHIVVDFLGREVDIDAIEMAIDAQVVEPEQGQTFDVTVTGYVNADAKPVVLSTSDLMVLIAALDRQRNTWNGPDESWPGTNVRHRLCAVLDDLNEGR